MKRPAWRECLSYAVYYAPRGRPRLLLLGETIAQRYLEPTDHLIGVIGEPGTGKSSLIRGMFPGLELTNDDAGVNVRPLPLVQMYREGRFRAQTFHLDARFEMAFTQTFELVDAVRAALRDNRRVVVENFDAIYPALGINAQIMAGIGEEIIVVRPDLFGPFPEDLFQAVRGTAVFRRMAHTAEDITAMVLEQDFAYPHPQIHSDIPRGFVMEFDEAPPNLRLDELEAKVREIINAALPVCYTDEDHISVGADRFPCSGPRIHLSNTAEIEGFRIVPELIYDELNGTHCLVGFVGAPKAKHFLGRHLPPEPR
ncbi:MAG: alanine-tRNA synthetase second additional domain-containing protein [Actinobacteria bacterium]|nr:alanine-tRNA synthetase second additional domain-containing protein [Actinomycetota bacterium]